MDLLRDIIEDPARFAPMIAALAGICAVLAAAWPYLQRDNLSKRIAGMDVERERVRARERRSMVREGANQQLRRLAPRRAYQVIVERLKLTAKLQDPKMAASLNRAGYRGPGVATKFLAMRVIGGVTLSLVSIFYTFFLLKLAYPLAVHVLIAIIAGAIGHLGPKIYIKNVADKRRKEIQRSWPDALDLMLICVQSGMSIQEAFRKVAQEIAVQSGALAEELSLTTAELSYLQDRRKAYENLAKRVDLDTVRAVVTSLIQAETYGTPLGRALRVLAQESRDQRMSIAERKAASLPPKLTVPMIIFFLPVLFAVIMSPAIMQMMRQ